MHLQLSVSIWFLASYTVAIEGIKNSWYIAAQNANGDARIVQCQPAATGLLRAMTAEQMVAH